MSEAIFKRMRDAAKSQVDLQESKSLYRIQRPCGGRKAFGDVGLELEVEGNNLPKFVDFLTPETAVPWTNHDDGSLRGENNEYVTNGPIKIAEVEPMVGALFTAFAENGTVLKLSNRCSTHVHVNCSMLSPKPITSFVALFTIVEETVCHWCGDDRVSNPFALRVIDSNASIEKWEDWLNGEHVEFNKNDKYNGMNLRPLFDMGSIEFRHMRGADTPELVVRWVNFLWALREEARTQYQNPNKLAQEVSARGVVGVIDEFVKRHGLEDLWLEICQHPLNDGLVERQLRRGFLAIQHLLFALRWDMVADREEPGEAPEDAYARKDKEARMAAHDMVRANPAMVGAAPAIVAPAPRGGIRAGAIGLQPIALGRNDPFAPDRDIELRNMWNDEVQAVVAKPARAPRKPKPQPVDEVAAVDELD